MRNKPLTRAARYASLLLLGVAPHCAQAQRRYDGVRRISESNGVETFHVQGNVYMIAGAGGNISVQVGDDSLLVVDTGLAPMSQKVLAAIHSISDIPIRYIVNTHFDVDHTGGNIELAKAGKSISGFNGTGFAVIGDDALKTAAIIAHDNVLKRMGQSTGKRQPLPFAAWPTEVFLSPVLEFFSGEAIQVFHEPNAHTDGDSIVFFRRSDVISTGDIFSTISYPVVERENGGSIKGIIDALDHILDLAIPKAAEEGGTYIIPGHGRICDEADVVEYRDMLVIVRDRMRDLIKQGKSLTQIRDVQPTLDYDGRYGSEDGPWTTSMFIEAIYRELVSEQ